VKERVTDTTCLRCGALLGGGPVLLRKRRNTPAMTRGNQRDLNRKRGEKKAAAAASRAGATSRQAFKDTDANIMREKQRLAEMKKQEAAGQKDEKKHDKGGGGGKK